MHYGVPNVGANCDLSTSPMSKHLKYDQIIGSKLVEGSNILQMLQHDGKLRWSKPE